MPPTWVKLEGHVAFGLSVTVGVLGWVFVGWGVVVCVGCVTGWVCWSLF